MSPKFLSESGFVFKVFSREEVRKHIHIEKDNNKAKVWLEPKIELAKNKGFKKHDINKILKIVKENASNFKEQWNRYFGG